MKKQENPEVNYANLTLNSITINLSKPLNFRSLKNLKNCLYEP